MGWLMMFLGLGNIAEIIGGSLPAGAMLRDYQRLPGVWPASYLAIYVDRGYRSLADEEMADCMKEVLGPGLWGVYHLALFRGGKVVNEVVIPEAYTGQGENILSASGKLLELSDRTGDGKRQEFRLTTSAGVCGFTDSLVGGYDLVARKAKLYSGWLLRFDPDRTGKAGYVIECGDHGNMTREEVKYVFDKKNGEFVKLSEKSEACRR